MAAAALLQELRAANAYDKSGKLVKLGARVKNWKERVFALSKNNKTMYYFDSEASFKKHEENDQLRNFLGTVDLSNAWIYMMDGFLEQKNCFAICTPKRNFYISAPDNKTMGDWVEAIGAAGVKVKLPAMQGWLGKKGEWNTALQRRFFRTEVVGGKNVLQYYEILTEDPKGSIELEGAEVSVYAALHLQIKVKGQKRTYILKADSDKSRDEWISVLQSVTKSIAPVERLVTTDVVLARKPAAAATSAAAAAPAAAVPAAAPEKQAEPAAEVEATYFGACLCGQCKIRCAGKPIFAGFCHCSLCSKYGNTDRSLLTGWAKDKFQVTEGKDVLTAFKSSEKATRYFCGNCGTGVYTDSGGFFGCSPALFGAEDGFRLPAPLLPQVHLYYGSSCLLGVVKDGGQLALYNDVPKTFGGSGETIQE